MHEFDGTLWEIKDESLATIFQGISHAEKTNGHIFTTREYDDEQRQTQFLLLWSQILQ